MLMSWSAYAFTVDEIIAKANVASYYAGTDGSAEARMLIVDSQGNKQRRQFHILRRDISDGGAQDFLVVFSRPADVRGTVFLVNKKIEVDDDRWLYLPSLDLVKRIAAGDKRTSFVGAHFFYEDVSGRNIHVDQHKLTSETDSHYVVLSTPKDKASVEFAEYEVMINKQTFIPEIIKYKNDNGQIYRTVEVQKVETIQGHPTVVESKVSDINSGGYTLMQFRNIRYDLGLSEDVFSERSLRNPPSKWLN